MSAWYCKIDDIEHGPLSQDELVKMAGDGRLAPNDLVRNEQKNKWYKARTVKGLKFPDGKPTASAPRGRDAERPAPTGTSAEAIKLLKGLTKKGGGGGGTGLDVSVQTRQADDWKPAQSAVMQRSPRKPLDPRTRRILWGAAAVMLALVLFPPHTVPPNRKMPDGWYFAPIFSPPKATVKVETGIGDLIDRNVKFVQEEDGTYVESPMPINWTWLLLECLAVIVIAAGIIGFVAARSAAAQVPEVRPAHPPRRRQV